MTGETSTVAFLPVGVGPINNALTEEKRSSVDRELGRGGDANTVTASCGHQAVSMKSAALWYASGGVPVFPLHNPVAAGCSCGNNPGLVPADKVCRSVGKHPRTASGFKDATTDAEQIASLWDKWPDSNIGIPTGVVTGILLLDQDFRGDGPKDRDEVITRFGSWPVTAESTTGSGGNHVFFKYGGGRVPKGLAPGVDLKGDGGYFVAPPSLHASGRRYTFAESDVENPLLNLAPAPQWLLDVIAARNDGGGAHKEPVGTPTSRKVQAGNRHNHLVSIAGTMRNRGVSAEVIDAALQVENRERCDPPKPEAEVGKIAASVAQYAPEGWPDMIPLDANLTDSIPKNCLPGWLGEMAAAVAESTETPFEMSAMLALAVASCCVASRADVSPEPGYTEPLNLFVCPAMESGNRKTAVHTRLTAPLLEYERIETQRTAPERQRLISEYQTIQAHVNALRRRVKKGETQRAAVLEIQELEKTLPEVPARPRLFSNDVTPEKLASMLQEQGGRMGIFSDEGGIFDIVAGRYSNGVPNLDLWLKAHSASPVRVDRQDPAKPPIIIDKPHLTVGLSPQPDVLAALGNQAGFRARGLIARFLFVLPASRLGYRTLTPMDVPADIEARYRNGIHALLNYRPDPMLHLVFEPESYREWKDLQRALEPQFRNGGKLENMKDWGSKLPGAAARIAGVLHMAKYAGAQDIPDAIEVSTMVLAAELTVSLISHFGAVLVLMNRDPEMKRAERVLAWILRQDSSFFSGRECFRAHQGLFKRVNLMTPTLMYLQECGYIRVVKQASSGGRCPSDLCEVNPAVRKAGGA